MMRGVPAARPRQIGILVLTRSPRPNNAVTGLFAELLSNRRASQHSVETTGTQGRQPESQLDIRAAGQLVARLYLSEQLRRCIEYPSPAVLLHKVKPA